MVLERARDGGKSGRKRASRTFSMQIKFNALLSFARINHNWAGSHSHGGKLMTHFGVFFGSCTQNLCGPILLMLLCVFVWPAFTDACKRIKKSDYQSPAKLTVQHTAKPHPILPFSTSMSSPKLFFFFNFLSAPRFFL